MRNNEMEECVRRIVLLLFALLATIALSPLATAPALAEPIEAKVSIVMINLSGVDLAAGTFDANFYLVFDCKVECDAENWELVNATEYTSELIQDPANLLDDQPLNPWYRISGTFAFQPSLRLFPFDTQELPIVIEHKLLDESFLVLVPDQEASDVSAKVGVPGWLIEPFTFTYDQHKFSDLEESYSELTFAIPVTRSAVSSVLKYYVPLIIFVLLGVTALFVSTNELQLTNAGTALVGLTVFYFFVGYDIGGVGYLTVYDASIVLGYLILGLVVVAGIVDAYQKRRVGADTSDEAVLERSHRIRFGFLRAIAILIVVGAIAITTIAFVT